MVKALKKASLIISSVCSIIWEPRRKLLPSELIIVEESKRKESSSVSYTRITR